MTHSVDTVYRAAKDDQLRSVVFVAKIHVTVIIKIALSSV